MCLLFITHRNFYLLQLFQVENCVSFKQRIRGIIQIKDDDISLYKQQKHQDTFFSVCFFMDKLPLVLSAVGEHIYKPWKKEFLHFYSISSLQSSLFLRTTTVNALTAGLTWSLWGDGSTLPKTSDNQRGCGKNQSEINGGGASKSLFSPFC